MTYTAALEYIHALHRFGRKPELTRVNMLLEKLGNPQKSLRFIHVAGTNGKGSTSVMLASILRKAGYRTGLYTSPYVVDFRERIVLDGEMIAQDELAALTAEVAEKAAEVEAEYEAPREFEFITALAFLYYSRKPCDIVVLEVGLGGQFDATNVIDPPLVTVITPIGLDHTDLLGDTLGKIAGEKCGIIKAGSVVVTSPNQASEAMDVIIHSCRCLGCPLVVPQLPQMQIDKTGLDGTEFIYHGYPFTISMVGQHQIRNAMTAIDAALTLTSLGLTITLHQIAEGLQTAYIPGRLEVFHGKPMVLLDGAHNLHGILALRESIFAMGSRTAESLVAVMGMLADKNCIEALDIIAPFLREIIVTQPDSPRALPAAELAELAKNYCSNITVEPDCQKAVRLALESGTETVLIFGSLYLVSAVRPMLSEQNDCHDSIDKHCTGI
ncbi:MAG: folylpolyglutamate synthase/dihydrofolate synthase family protein [Angelakisella sp.]